MPIFRFCRIIEDRGRQYLVRAANTTALVHPGHQHKPTNVLTVETWITHDDGMDWDNARIGLPQPDQVAMLMALECFTKEHAREACRLIMAMHVQQLCPGEVEEAGRQLGDSVQLAVAQRYGLPLR